MQRDSYVDEWSLIAPWPRQSGSGATLGSAARPAGTAEGLARALAVSRHQLTQAKGAGDARRKHPHLGMQGGWRRRQR